MAKGTIVTNRPVGETSGICCNNPMQRKKMLAYRRNCSYKNLGRKVNNVYFVVDILFDAKELLSEPPVTTILDFSLGVSMLLNPNNSGTGHLIMDSRSEKYYLCVIILIVLF